MMRKLAKDLEEGVELIDSETSSRLRIWDIEESSALPGLIKADCPFGTIYLDPDTEVEYILS